MKSIQRLTNKFTVSDPSSDWCSTYKLSKTSFTADLHQKWIHAVRRKDFSPFHISVLCSEHFLPKEFLDGQESRPLKKGEKVDFLNLVKKNLMRTWIIFKLLLLKIRLILWNPSILTIHILFHLIF
ncbi:unnamed protein product [Lepeophtheirus salmonis]|uniref:(salmon louse) hypothetical protein n=1 Tax=Lepeophtheirus salmonis TaxID=72036 RepID=A0A7R8H7G0_LEPSM|nr:unnamed protein product [Lepeophtheirus salmonis]CAF2920063.1 unnamed protein product [Lepeophtheirus salmonis]